MPTRERLKTRKLLPFLLAAFAVSCQRQVAITKALHLPASGDLQDSACHYLIKDCQGNVRAVADQNGTLEEINNYYPYGGLMAANSHDGVQPCKYSGKELDRENGLDLYDFSARLMNPMLPLFTTQVPLAEKYFGISPYVYCAGNPVKLKKPLPLKQGLRAPRKFNINLFHCRECKVNCVRLQ